jgi:hypothetical protein
MSNRIRTADAEAILAGRPSPDPAPALGEVESFFAAMRDDYGARPAPEPRPVLASILDGRRPLRTVAEPAAPTPARPSPWLGRHRRPRPAAAPWLGRHRWPRPVAAALATGTLLFSGLAVAGALPAPVQRVSADVGASLGVDLPRPSDPGSPPAHLSPRPGTGRTGAGTKVPTPGPANPSPTRPITGASGAVPAVPTFPSLPLPSGPAPSVSPSPAPLGPDQGALLPDLPEVPRVVPSP